MLDKFKTQVNDVIFLVDISLSMGGGKIYEAIKAINNVFQNQIEPSDRISYVLFNEKTHIILSLREKKEINTFLSRLLKNIPE